MASFISALNPVPAFPGYTGPYQVGTIDVEVPVSELVPPSRAPEGAADVHTVLFRIFYPAVPESRGKRVSWLPAPQRLHVAAYARFLGLGSRMASVLSFIPRHLHWTSIPAYKNARLLPPPSDRPRSRWPTIIFSHGLGGNRNAYSHLAGSMASYGVVVICSEHRDGSAPLSLIRDPKNHGAWHSVPYIRIPHDQTHETWEARNKQLRIRLWELGLIFEAISGIDRGDEQLIKSNLNSSTPEASLSQFTAKLDILEPGKVIFAGHSFGAATMVQLLKSTFYTTHPDPSLSTMPSPLFTPSPTSVIAKQITPHNPTILLDMWCFPLLSASTAQLYNLPLPCYSSSAPDSPSPGGSALLAIESAHFFAWTTHLHVKARILSPHPSARTVTPSQFNPSSSEPSFPHPYFFYTPSSAHLSQSDFGILFPFLTKRVFKCTAPPERVMRLNVRAQLQFLRKCGVIVGGTARGDLVDGYQRVGPGVNGVAGGDSDGTDGGGGSGKCTDEEWWVEDDRAILERTREGKIEGWEWVDVVGLGGESYPSEVEMMRKSGEGKGEEERERRAEEGEKEMEGEMEPSLEADIEGAAVEAGQEAAGDK